MTETLIVFQGGGPTAVINASLAGVLHDAAGKFARVLGLRHSLERTNEPATVDLTPLIGPGAQKAQTQLSRTPGAALGSSREKATEAHLAATLELMQWQGARGILGIGGNGTMTALHKLSELAHSRSFDISVVGAPKTVDNDLPGAAFAPGYGSAARFVALAVRDFDCDFRAMQTFDDVTILETMGRDTGWLAAASTILRDDTTDAPHMILIPERPVEEEAFLARVSELRGQLGRVFIVTNEMVKAPDGSILGAEIQDGPRDGLGRVMYSLSTGTGNYLARLIWKRLGLQARCLRPGNLGRAFSNCVSLPDHDLAWRVGREAVSVLKEAGPGARMVTVDKKLQLGTQPAFKGTGRISLPDRFLPENDPFGISPAFAVHARPIIGEVDSILPDIDRLAGRFGSLI
jgi:6-phosphofructokinase